MLIKLTPNLIVRLDNPNLSKRKVLSNNIMVNRIIATYKGSNLPQLALTTKAQIRVLQAQLTTLE